MNDKLVRAAADVRPAFHNQVLPITMNTTATTYDLSTLDFGTEGDLVVNGQEAGEFWVDMVSNGAFYYLFSNVSTVTVSKTAAVAVGAALAFTANAGDYVPSDFRIPFKIDRRRHRYISLLAESGTPILRIHKSSGLASGSVQEIF